MASGRNSVSPTGHDQGDGQCRALNRTASWMRHYHSQRRTLCLVSDLEGRSCSQRCGFPSWARFRQDEGFERRSHTLSPPDVNTGCSRRRCVKCRRTGVNAERGLNPPRSASGESSPRALNASALRDPVRGRGRSTLWHPAATCGNWTSPSPMRELIRTPRTRCSFPILRGTSCRPTTLFPRSWFGPDDLLQGRESQDAVDCLLKPPPFLISQDILS